MKVSTFKVPKVKVRFAREVPGISSEMSDEVIAKRLLDYYKDPFKIRSEWWLNYLLPHRFDRILFFANRLKEREE